MHETIFRAFFLGIADISSLRADLVGTVARTSHDVFTHHVIDMDSDFSVSGAHLVWLCDAALSGELPAEDLSAIATCLELSDRFQWDSRTPEGRLVADTLAAWISPEINYPLTSAVMAKFRHRLVTSEDTFTRADACVIGKIQ